VLAGVILIGAVGAWATTMSERGVPETERGPTGAVCAMAEELRSTFAAGEPSPAEARTALDELALAANDASEAVRVAAQRWAASGQPGDATFKDAQSGLVAACSASG
jgi:hypothetical protein